MVVKARSKDLVCVF